MKGRVAILALLVLLTGCGTPSTDEGGPRPDEPGLLRVLGGSELADLQPILDEAAAATGVRVHLDQVGTVDGALQVGSGEAGRDHDAIWFSSNRYLSLDPAAQAKLGTTVDIMSSPVVLGLRRSVAERLGWVGRPVTWAEIARAAGSKRFSYGMTDPSASNTGFSAVVAVATALVGSGSALTAEQATSAAPALRDFFAAQVLSAGSSGFLTDAYVRRANGTDPGPAVDGLINYESVLLSMNASGQLPEPLELIHPADGVVTADYPFAVLNSASAEDEENFRTLTEYLRTPEVQRRIAELTFRRPALPGLVPPPSAATPVELPFPAEAQVVDALLISYFDQLRRPSRTIYVLDTSGSMADGDRIGDLHRALAALAGADPSTTGRFSWFRAREEVTLLPFSDAPQPPQTFTVAGDDPGPGRQAIADAGNALRPGGGTAIYDSLRAADRLAEQSLAADPDRFTSVVLMTDGQNTAGSDFDDFQAYLGSRSQALRGVPIFTVLFGEADDTEMTEIARLTGGRAFNARQTPLPQVFKEIRGYV